MLNVLLAGSPNVGKTTLYNNLTKSFEQVGNWQGVTVEKKIKEVKYKGKKIRITDLPGLFSLSVYSPDEAASRDELFSFMDGVIINVCDAGNLSRNLYLTLQLLELGLPVVLAINMMGELNKKGKEINAKLIEQQLKVPVVCLDARKAADCKKLLEKAVEFAAKKKERAVLPYLKELPVFYSVKKIISQNTKKLNINPDFLAIKVLEKDNYIINRLDLSLYQKQELAKLGNQQAKVAQLRYKYIDYLYQGTIFSRTKSQKAENNHQKNIVGLPKLSKLDKIVLNKYLAFPIFLLVMLLIFTVTFFLVGKWLTIGLETLLQKFKHLVIVFLTKKGVKEWLVSIIGSGIIGGVGAVLVFLPQIALLIFFLSLLQDSGYISRVAFMTDGMFRKIGLSGKAVFTLLMGFGCSVTALLSAKGLEDKNMRKKTILITPFMSCSARLPVYLLIVSKFFDGNPLIIFGLYLFGALVGIIIAAILQNTKALKSGRQSFVMEMPPYRFPTATRLIQLIWHNIKTFLVKVGTVIVLTSIIIWLLSSFSFDLRYIGENYASIEDSILAKLAKTIMPLFKPLGFGNWRAVSTLLSGLASKESIIAAIENLGGISEIFVGSHQSLKALSFMVFVLLYVPCFATLAAINQEIGLRFVFLSFFMQTLAAYIFSLLLYTFGLLFAYNPLIVGGAACTITILFIIFKAIRQIKIKKDSQKQVKKPAIL